MALNTSNSTPLDFATFYNIIDGKLEGTAQTRHTVSPSTLEQNPPLPLSTAEDAHNAVAAAQKAVKKWAEVPWDERKKAVEGFAEALESQAEEFAQMLNTEQGKPVSSHLDAPWLPLLTSRTSCCGPGTRLPPAFNSSEAAAACLFLRRSSRTRLSARFPPTIRLLVWLLASSPGTIPSFSRVERLAPPC